MKTYVCLGKFHLYQNIYFQRILCLKILVYFVICKNLSKTYLKIPASRAFKPSQKQILIECIWLLSILSIFLLILFMSTLSYLSS